MFMNTCKTVDHVQSLLKTAYNDWENSRPLTFWLKVKTGISLATFGLACMRMQREVSEEKWAQFFSVLWDAQEGGKN